MGVYHRKSNDGKKIWYIDFYVNGRRVREKVGESKTQAKAVLAKRKGEIVSGKFKLKDTIKSTSFDKFAEDYIEWAKLNKKSWERDKYSILHLTRYFGAKRLPEISTWLVERYKRDRIKNFRTAWENAVKRSGIGRFRIHDLRHQWGSEMGEHTDLKTLMQLGGWKRPEIPMRYVHPSVDHKRDCLERLVEKNQSREIRARVLEMAG